jgi:hypothetical protein
MYLALADGPAIFTQGYTCPTLLWKNSEGISVSNTGLLPPVARLSSQLLLQKCFVTSLSLKIRVLLTLIVAKVENSATLA